MKETEILLSQYSIATVLFQKKTNKMQNIYFLASSARGKPSLLYNFSEIPSTKQRVAFL